MPTHVAFLRAINLGARRTFPRAAVRAAVEAAGGTEVETYLNTGNVRLRSSLRSRARVERSLEQAFLADRGFEVPTVVLSPAELADVAAYAATLTGTLAPGGRHYVELLRDQPSAEAVAALATGVREGCRAYPAGRAVHLLVDDPTDGVAPLRAGVVRLLGVTTNRNVRVVSEVASRWAGWTG